VTVAPATCPPGSLVPIDCMLRACSSPDCGDDDDGDGDDDGDDNDHRAN
jgi:hypothetical protein